MTRPGETRLDLQANADDVVVRVTDRGSVDVEGNVSWTDPDGTQRIGYRRYVRLEFSLPGITVSLRGTPPEVAALIARATRFLRPDDARSVYTMAELQSLRERREE